MILFFNFLFSWEKYYLGELCFFCMNAECIKDCLLTMLGDGEQYDIAYKVQKKKPATMLASYSERALSLHHKKLY